MVFDVVISHKSVHKGEYSSMALLSRLAFDRARRTRKKNKVLSGVLVAAAATGAASGGVACFFPTSFFSFIFVSFYCRPYCFD